MLFIDAFIQNNRLDHVTQLMGYHPEYLDCFLKTQQYLLRGDGPLPYHFRHYIAIMVSPLKFHIIIIMVEKSVILHTGVIRCTLELSAQ